MKNKRQEKLRILQRQYHRNHQWKLSSGGYYIPHDYTEKTPNMLSWWDDVGFILNKRRIIVWWEHPRMVYMDAIEKCAN